MAIAQTSTTSFKVELLQCVHNFGPTSPDVFKVALYTSAANLGASTTEYTTTGEVVGGGYTAGGLALTIATSPTSGTNGVAFISFGTATWPSATTAARGALIYNASKANKSVCVLDFGGDKTVTQIVFPAADANSAIVRIA